MIPFFDMNSGHDEIETHLVNAFHRVVKSGHVIMGTELRAFEDEFAEYCGASHCIGVGNGLDALALTLRAKGVGPGDEVIVPSQTFIATWLAVSMVGAVPIPVEVNDEYLIDPTKIRDKLTRKTRAIIPVHLFGLPADMDEINVIANESDLFVLEDAAQAHGARYKGRSTGNLAHAAAFSFYPTKNLGALGDGGAVVTNDTNLAHDLRRLRNYGSQQKYVHEVAGVNSRLDEMQAAFLRVKLPHLDSANARRRILATRYSEGLANVPGIKIPRVPPEREHVFHLYVIECQRRDELHAYLQANKVSTLIHYPVAPHMQGAYSHLGLADNSLPIAKRMADQSLSLPMWPQMKEQDVDEVISHIREFML